MRGGDETHRVVGSMRVAALLVAFVLVRKQGGKRVVKLVRKSLDERGEARVRIRAARGGSVDAIKLRIVLGRCSQDPPLFPVDCEVERSGKHV